MASVVITAVAVTLAVGAAPAARAAEPDEGPAGTPTLERERRLVETYRQMLAQEPAQEYAFRRMLETAHAVGGVVGLVQLYRAEVDKNPNDYAAWLVLGNLLRTADNADGAREAFGKAAALEPNKADPHLLMAALHRDKRAFAEAFAAYDKALTLLKDRDAKQEALRAAAEAAVEAKEVARAQAYFEKLAQTEPQNLFLRMQAASALARLEQPALALDMWQQIEAKAGGQLDVLVVVWKEVAELQAQLGRHGDAEATWRKGLERLPSGHYERRAFIDGLIGVHRRVDRLRELAVELEPKAERDVELALALARIHEELAEDDKALHWYREAQKRRPNEEEPRMAALAILERIGRPEEILQAWVDLVRAFPREPRHELKLAELYFQHGKAKEAGEALKRISRTYAQDPGVHTHVVDLWLRYGDKASRVEVENEYKILQRIEPDEAGHVMSLGEYYWSSEDRARAQQTWRRLLKMGRAAGEGHFMLGEILAEHELVGEAEVELRAAIEEAPENPRYRRALALLHEKSGRTAEALEEWTRIADKGAGGRATPATREAREHIIQLWDKGERLDGEIAELQRRFAAEPPDVSAGRFLAVALLKLGRIPDARTVLERLDQIQPEDLETLAGLEQVYTRQSEPKRAIAILERLARAAPRAAVEYLHRAAELALGMGDETTALRAAREVVELAPADASAHARVGELYLRMGHRSEAAESWRQALALEPRNFAVRFKLASLYRDMGNPGREEQVLAEIVREAPDGSDILRAGRRLLQLALATGRLVEVEALLRPLVDPGGGRGRGRGAQLRLVVDVYGHLAQAIRYGADAREARDKKLAELGERALRPLLEALEDEDVATRARAIDTLELTHPAGATPALARLAVQPESMAQVEAIAALGRIGSDGAVAALGRLGASSSSAVRELALWALGFAPTAEATALLSERARRGSPKDRQLVAAAIGYGRHPDAMAIALELARDRSPDVRELGVWAIGRLARPEGAAELAERLARPTTAREAQLAAWGLGQIGTPEAKKALVDRLWSGTPFGADDAIWQALAFEPRRLANDDSVEAVYDALAARDRVLVQSPRPSLYQPERPEVAANGAAVAPSAALAALADVRGEGGAVARRVRVILERPDQAARLALAEALVAQAWPDGDGARGELSLWPPLYGDGRAAAKAALAGLDGLVIKALEGESEPTTRDTWLAVLARWPGPLEGAARARAVALDALALPDVAGADAAALARRPVRGALMFLAEDDGLAAGLKAGGRVGREALGRGLERLLRHPSPDVRAALATTLAALGDGPAQATLHALAQDPVPLVRIGVAQAIARERLAVDAALTSDLFDLVHDPLPDVSVAAVRALVAQGRADLVARLQDEPAPHVQRAVRERSAEP